MQNDLTYTVSHSDVLWEMRWTERDDKGMRLFPDMPDTTQRFEPEKALAMLLLAEVVFLNDHWWEKTWPKEAQSLASLNVVCSDAFGYASADAQGLEFPEIQDLFEHWAKDPVWGSTVWCCKKRGIMPTKRTAQRIQKAGIWDLPSLNLSSNQY